jgi:hypothetical protein
MVTRTGSKTPKAPSSDRKPPASPATSSAAVSALCALVVGEKVADCRENEKTCPRYCLSQIESIAENSAAIYSEPLPVHRDRSAGEIRFRLRVRTAIATWPSTSGSEDAPIGPLASSSRSIAAIAGTRQFSPSRVAPPATTRPVLPQNRSFCTDRYTTKTRHHLNSLQCPSGAGQPTLLSLREKLPSITPIKSPCCLSTQQR